MTAMLACKSPEVATDEDSCKGKHPAISTALKSNSAEWARQHL